MRTKIIPILAVVILIAAAAGGTAFMNKNEVEIEGDIAVNEISREDAISEWASGDAEPVDISPAAGTSEAAPQTTSTTHASVVVDGSDPKQPKSIGSVDAPVVMKDFSSLTCPHCARAHLELLPRLIEEYVNTGKLRIIFSDFPLNKEALDGSKVARCVSNDQYYGFLSLLFGSIESWAYSGNHPEGLLQNAALAGLSTDRAKECLEDAELEKAILQDLQKAAQDHQVTSTPTFVLNDGEKVILGARPYEDFAKAIDQLIENAENDVNKK